ncbi:MAG: PH domain-containing protein [Candidatus Thiothrix sulfatifontis]|nr:MAG: PH domain-containing protein [Candidatus Thiothrix sulfatifontis]
MLGMSGIYGSRRLTSAPMGIVRVLTIASVIFLPLNLVVLALGIALLVVVITGLLSVAGAMLSFFDYSLVQRGERYIQRCGLFTRHEVSMKLSRLQWVQLQQSWLDRVFGRCNVHFEQIQAPRADSAEAGRITGSCRYTAGCAGVAGRGVARAAFSWGGCFSRLIGVF